MRKNRIISCLLALLSLHAGLCSENTTFPRFSLSGTESSKNPVLFPIEKAVMQEGEISYRVSDYQGNLVTEGMAQAAPDGFLPLTLDESTGYYEVMFPGLNIQPMGFWMWHEDVTPHDRTFWEKLGRFFGFKRSEKTTDSDPFFCIDTALSWLVKPEQSTLLIPQIPVIVGKDGLSRERLSWAAVNPKPGIFEWDKYESIREDYSRNGVGVLEMFHDVPAWMGRSQKGKFPDDLIAASDSWSQVAARWQKYWSALEVWNEPDIGLGGNQPADQYVPIVKTIRWAMRSHGIETKIGGGVFATMHHLYVDLSARNGLLDECDFLAFHYYGDPLGLERLIRRYRNWLEKAGYANKPLWITEIGQPRPGTGHTRPSVEVQKSNALFYTMQLVEAKACGIERCFPFVLPEYSEHGGSRDFGLLDHKGTALRALAGLAQARNMLSDKSYIGDLPGGSLPGTKRIRVFQNDHNSEDVCVVVYTGETSADAKISVPFPVKEARGVDGRVLGVDPSGFVPIPDGLVYLSTDLKAISEMLQTQTEAAALKAMADGKTQALPALSPIILQPKINPDQLKAMSTRGYFLNKQKSLPLSVIVNNLGAEKHTVTVQVAGSAESKVEVDGKSRKIVECDIDVASLPDGLGDSKTVRITATSPGVERIGAVELDLLLAEDDRGIADYLKEAKYQLPLAVRDDYRWQENSSGKLSFVQRQEDTYGYTVEFPPKVDRWAYPKFRLPQEVDPKSATGILVRARCLKPAAVRVMSWDAQGEQSFTSFPIFPADGNWHVVYVPFSSYLSDAGRQLPTEISIGMNSMENTNEIEISDLIIIGK